MSFWSNTLLQQDQTQTDAIIIFIVKPLRLNFSELFNQQLSSQLHPNIVLQGFIHGPVLVITCNTECASTLMMTSSQIVMLSLITAELFFNLFQIYCKQNYIYVARKTHKRHFSRQSLLMLHVLIKSMNVKLYLSIKIHDKPPLQHIYKPITEGWTYNALTEITSSQNTPFFHESWA